MNHFDTGYVIKTWIIWSGKNKSVEIILHLIMSRCYVGRNTCNVDAFEHTTDRKWSATWRRCVEAKVLINTHSDQHWDTSLIQFNFNTLTIKLGWYGRLWFYRMWESRSAFPVRIFIPSAINTNDITIGKEILLSFVMSGDNILEYTVKHYKKLLSSNLPWWRSHDSGVPKTSFSIVLSPSTLRWKNWFFSMHFYFDSV